MQAFTNKVSLALILLWSHERGELCNKTIPAAAAQPELTLVKKDGSPIDVTVSNYDGSDAYGVHLMNGQVYWANAVINSEHIAWPENATDAKKALIIAHLEKSFLIIK